MSFFKKNPNEVNYQGGKKHFTDVIKNTSVSNALAWRQPEEDFNTNSTLIVQPGEQAIFLKDGLIEEVFDAGRHVLSTNNYPFISRLRNAFSGGISTFNCVVYFVRIATSLEIRWGTDTPIQIRDKMLGVQTNLMARGSYRVKIADAGKFLTYFLGNRINSLEPDDLQDYIGREFLTDIKSTIATYANESDSELLGISSRQRELSDKISPILREALEKMGMQLERFSISGLDLADDELRRRYDEIGMDVYAKVRNAQGDRAVMDTLGTAWAAQQQVDILKNMSQQEGGLSGAGAQIGAGLMGGMAGYAIGQQVFNGGVTAPATTQPAAPPPLPQQKNYYLAINGQQVGPLSMAMLQSYVGRGLSPQTLVWCEGMANWAPAASVPEVAVLFNAPAPPPIPVP